VIGIMRESNVLPFLGGRLSKLMRKHHVPGAQLAIHHQGETVTLEASGELEQHTGRRVTGDTAFPIGSISKSFTATLAMILVADGDLELDVPIERYLPGMDDLGSQFTLRHLLSHTSGLNCGPDSVDVFGASPRRYVADHCRYEDLVVRPGTAFSYSNTGYVLVGHLIETVTGMTWWEAMESILLRPLGIDPAFVGASGHQPSVRPIAVGHSVNAVTGRTRAVAQSLAAAEAPTGGLAVSASDLVALGRLHIDLGMPDLLPADVAAQMRTAVRGADPSGLAEGWGLGLAVFGAGTASADQQAVCESGLPSADQPAEDWVGHDGNANGTACYLRVSPEDGWVVAFTSNANTGYGLWQELVAELAQTNVPIGRSSAVVNAQPTSPAVGSAGTFANGDVEYVVAARPDGHRYLAVDGDAFARLRCYEDLTFSTRDPNSGGQVLSGRFLKDPVTKRINAIQVGGRHASRHTPFTHDGGRRLVA
jgi:CubicO group peptidase (beta-lactamase class C family)